MQVTVLEIGPDQAHLYQPPHWRVDFVPVQGDSELVQASLQTVPGNLIVLNLTVKGKGVFLIPGSSLRSVFTWLGRPQKGLPTYRIEDPGVYTVPLIVAVCSTPQLEMLLHSRLHLSIWH